MKLLTTAHKPVAQQAQEYIARVGLDEARQSNHYLTAKRHCTCGTCFCCEVFRQVNEQDKQN